MQEPRERGALVNNGRATSGVLVPQVKPYHCVLSIFFTWVIHCPSVAGNFNLLPNKNLSFLLRFQLREISSETLAYLKAPTITAFITRKARHQHVRITPNHALRCLRSPM